MLTIKFYKPAMDNQIKKWKHTDHRSKRKRRPPPILWRPETNQQHNKTWSQANRIQTTKASYNNIVIYLVFL